MGVSTWADLAAMRARGERPKLPVFVTTGTRLSRNLYGVGALTIDVKSGDKMPVRLLDGLDVILVLDNCMQSVGVKHLMDERDCRAKRLRAWCRCGNELTICPVPCQDFCRLNSFEAKCG